MDGRDTFLLNALPPIDAFYRRNYHSGGELTGAKNVEEFGIENTQQYYDLYLNLDVLLLADVFQIFDKRASWTTDSTPHTIILYPASHSVHVLKSTEQEFDLFTDSEKFLFIESSNRVGINVVSHRHAKANNLVPDYDHNSRHSYLIYLDADNRSGGAMSEALPIGDFNFLISVELVASFHLDATTKSDDYDYILEVDLKYPDHRHDLHSDYPFVREKLTITKEMLSAYPYSLTSKHGASDKLSPTLYDKTKFVVDYENLRFN